MSTSDQWQENNAQRLTAALAALRARMERAITPAPSAPKQAPVPPPTAAAPKAAPVVQTPPSATISRTLFQRLLRPPAPIEPSAPPAP